jgi:hypothetical protein
MRIHVNAIFKDNIFEEFRFGLREFTFFQLNVEFNFFELIQNKSNMLFMFLHLLGKNDDVIDVTNHKIIQVFMENIIY